MHEIRISSDVAARRRERGVDTLLVAGTATNPGCEATARDASMVGFKTVLVADANAARTDEDHDATLDNRFCDVTTVDEAMDHLGSKSAAGTG